MGYDNNKMKKYVSWSRFITKHKVCEVEVIKFEEDNQPWFAWDSFVRRKCDHAGFGFSLEVKGLSIEFQTYDVRHKGDK